MVTNTLKHADATTVRIAFADEGETLVVTFSDNGKGFDEDTLYSTGQGLRNIRYRIEESGGAVSLETKAGAGTRYTFRIPFSRSIL